MATYSKTYTLVITSGSPTGDTVYTAIDKLEDNIDQVITDLNNCHMTTNGALIYRASGATTQLAIGSANQVLTSSGTAPQWSNAYALPLYTYMPQRGIFTYNGGTSAATIKVKSARYWCKDKWCKWDEELTTAQAASGSPTAATWYYLYLDYSDITSGTAITTTTDDTLLDWSTTAPSWNAAYRGWYSGDDLCIFACRGNAAGNNFLEFFHDGSDVVYYADDIANSEGAVDPDTTFTDMTFIAPAFSQRIQATFINSANNAIVSFYWRTNGQTGSSGHLCISPVRNASAGYVANDVNSTVVFTDAAQKIEVKADGSSDMTITGYASAWFFPIGM